MCWSGVLGPPGKKRDKDEVGETDDTGDVLERCARPAWKKRDKDEVGETDDTGDVLKRCAQPACKKKRQR